MPPFPARLPLSCAACLCLLAAEAPAAFLTPTLTGITGFTSFVGNPTPPTAGPGSLSLIGGFLPGEPTRRTVLVYDIRPLAGASLSVASFSLDVIATTRNVAGFTPSVSVAGGGLTSPTPPFAVLTGGVVGLTGPIAAAPTPAAPARFDFDVTDFLQAVTRSGRSYVAFALSAAAGTGAEIRATPVLSVTFTPAAVPEPSSDVMLSVAGMVLGVVRWARRAASVVGG